MITVEEVMTTELYTLKPTDSVYEARKLMAEKHIRHIPIVDHHGTLVGLVTQRDLLAASISKLAKVKNEEQKQFETSTPVKKIMTTKLSVVPEKMSLRQAALRLQAYKYGCLPVVSNGHLKGIITDSDFVAVAINLLEQMEAEEPMDLLFED